MGNKPVASCQACGACEKLKRCVIDDKVNEFVEKMEHSDALIIASPVHYASSSGAAVSFMDRAFFSAYRSQKDIFAFKFGASVAIARRSGTTATFDQLNKYFTIAQMPIISGRYWNMVYGQVPNQVEEDKEGMQNMRILARNMAYFLKCKEAGIKAGINLPVQEEVEYTNFIR